MISESRICDALIPFKPKPSHFFNQLLFMFCLQIVIKDADVQKMLSNTLEEDMSKHEEATYEPKMTRAKMKQMLSEEGNVSVRWCLNSLCNHQFYMYLTGMLVRVTMLQFHQVRLTLTFIIC